ncbi:MAG: hypothetical protein AAFN10_01110 [Bacteroidota bacterium]
MHPFRNIIAPLFACLFLSLSFQTAAAQLNRFPANGEDGVPSAVPNSFLIGWSPFEGAAYYEYVLTDNAQCFIGCAGDTRLEAGADTVAVEYNLQPNRWYYWIVRIYFANGDTSEFSSIYSFFTEQPEDQQRLLTVASNPIVGGTAKLLIDWAQNEDAFEAQINIYDQNGNPRKRETIRRGLTALRFEEVLVPISDLPSGYYFMDVLIGNQNNRNNFYTLKIMVLGNE